MSTNKELAVLFEEMATVLELTGANPFRVNADARVARILRDMTTDISTLIGEDGDLKPLIALDGIGKGSAARIAEYVDTGKIAEHDKLMKKIPVGLLQVKEIPGLGPKTVRMLWENAGVTDLTTLEAAIDRGELEGLPRMGAKTIQNIRDSIKFAKGATRVRIGKALPIAETIVATLNDVPGVMKIEYAGSLRRGKETIGDIDILASAKDPERLAEAFRTMHDVDKVLVAGETKSSVRIRSGLQVDLRIVDASGFGAALMYFSGSKEHNVALRERAIRAGLRLNEYGLFPNPESDESPQSLGLEPVAAATEEDIYAALDLPWIPPTVREARGEINAPPPALIRLEDIRADLHAHTTASDGKLSIHELAEEAKKRGHHTIAVTDHSKSSVLAGGLDEARLEKHIEAVRAADADVKGIQILAGSEVDILVDGRLDYDDEMLAKLDVVVASPHVSLNQTPKKATERLLAAIRHPLVHILGHPTGRMINKREGLSPDIDALVHAAAEHDTALEINANPIRLDLRDIHVRTAVEAGALIAINTDAHRRDDFDLLRYGVLTGQRGWLTAKGCINTWTAKKLLAWLRKKNPV